MEDAEYEIMYRVEETHWWYRALHQLILDRLTQHLPGWREKSVLDAGCGTGAVLQRLGRMPNHVGVDLSPQAVAFCHQRGLSQVMRSDIKCLPFPANFLDAVVCSSVLYHRWVEDVGQALREFYRVLKPGGVLLINVPAFPSLHSEHDDRVFTARRFLRDEVKALLRTSHYELLECAYWTSLLFPLVWLARRFSMVRHGRDFEENKTSGLSNACLGAVMKVESALLKMVSFPAGVSIVAVARKPVQAKPLDSSI